MQAEPDSQAHLNNKGDVDGINFRPSSNFKHMKKYRKGNAASAGGESSGTRSEEEESRQGPESGTVQPPLPREPPPPDSPPITLKEEIVDEEYRGVGEVRPPDAAEPERERIMCRQFARGACTRGSSCIYAHEIIISQLPGIYTFCKDFQNSICSFARCKFVHASVFEKEYFYRSGYLPPHALAHLKQNAAPAPPPPPPGGVLTAEGDPSVRRVEVFPNLPPGAVVHPGPSGAMTGGGAEVRPPPDALAAAAGMPPHKRDWRLDDMGAAAARDADRAETHTNKCSHCHISEYRLQCNRNKLEKQMRASQELDKKLAALNRKNAKQLSVIMALMRQPQPSHQSNAKPGANLFNNSNLRNDNIEKAVMEKLTMLLAGNNGHSSTVDDTTKNLQTVLVRLLLSTGESQPAPADGS